MTYEAKVVQDSIAPNGVRLISTQLRYPRVVHAELMTHRVFSRNASSSRAIPVAKLVDLSLADPYFPIRWGLNQPGMQANEKDLPPHLAHRADEIWQRMIDVCAEGCKELAEIGVHKQWANRPTEWFGHISVVVTTTDLSNWDELRDHPDAQPEIQELARVWKLAVNDSEPVYRPRDRFNIHAWHLPYVLDEEREEYGRLPEDQGGLLLAKVSSARCARTSYMNHDGTNPVIEKDLKLFYDLAGARPLHASPTEHQGYPLPLATQRSKNLVGWRQHRELVEHLFY